MRGILTLDSQNRLMHVFIDEPFIYKPHKYCTNEANQNVMNWFFLIFISHHNTEVCGHLHRPTSRLN